VEFEKRYKNLNTKQRLAVNHIEGPLIVIAGPGSGKTELLAVRTANILKKTDTPPQSVLCLTFTSAAAINMKERLFNLIGEESYKVPVHTFHSFCLGIIENYPDLFFKGVDFVLADQPTKMKILESVLERLSFDDPLKKHHPEGGYAYLSDIERAIFYLQDGGVSPMELEKILRENKKEIKKINKLIGKFLEKRINKETLSSLEKFFNERERLTEGSSRLKPLSEVVFGSLKEAVFSGETTNLSEWKRKMTRRDGGVLVFKETLQMEKLESLAKVYNTYREEMDKRGYYTFSDMILNVTEVLERNESLRCELREKYLYLQIDEFQDTSGVQMRLLNLLTRDQVDEKPNICVVGDDDQAIYRFQGADISNILTFQEKYANAKMVVLLKNYRSVRKITDVSRRVVLKAEDRLENRFPGIKKDLVSETKNEGNIIGRTFQTKEEELSYVAKEVKKKIEKENPEEIAVIARTHNEIKEALCYLNSLKVPTFAERKENVLEKSHIREIVTILRFSAYLLEKEDKGAEALLPEILSFPFLKIKREKIWEIAKESHQKKISWIDYILDDSKTRDTGKFLLEVSSLAKTHPAEDVIDVIIGNKEVVLEGRKKFFSGFKDFYFKEKLEEGKTEEYLSFLSSLRCFITAVRKHRRKKYIGVKEAVDLVEFYEKNKIPILDKNPLVSEKDAVSLITAHGAKGREFETVFVLNCNQSSWGKEKGAGKLSFPMNLPLEKAGNKRDEMIRLFYVAITRAKKDLYLTTYKKKRDGRELMNLEFISDLEMEEKREKVDEGAVAYSINHENILSFCKNEKNLLLPLAENYKLSATGFNKFLNVDSGGPQRFFEDTLLRFPQKKTKMLSYGTAVHGAIAEIQYILKKEEKLLSEKEFLELFEKFLERERLSEEDFSETLKRGKKELPLFYKEKIKYFSPENIAEKNFADEGCFIGGVPITGKIDKMIIDGKSIKVFDYKTGAPLISWREKEENKKIKAWQYRNQLLFYKLLIESSRDFDGYVVSDGFLEFITPDKEKKIITLPLKIEEEDVRRVTTLIEVIGKKILSLNFPSVYKYKKKSLKSIQKFEEDLLEGNI